MANAIPNSGARDAALQTLIDYARRFREDVSYRTAVAGDGSGNVEIGGANRIYARLGADDGAVCEARVGVFTPADGDAILLKRETVMGLGGWLVLGWVSGTSEPCADRL